MFFIKNSKGEWWELDKETMTVSNFDGGFHNVTKQDLESSKIIEDFFSKVYCIICTSKLNLNTL